MIVNDAAVAAALPAYSLGGELGSGAFGLVLAGEHRQLRRPVAIKVGAAALTGDSGLGPWNQLVLRNSLLQSRDPSATPRPTVVARSSSTR
jgi:hypothetical protein